MGGNKKSKRPFLAGKVIVKAYRLDLDMCNVYRLYNVNFFNFFFSMSQFVSEEPLHCVSTIAEQNSPSTPTLRFDMFSLVFHRPLFVNIYES